ncbi:hypothetical protein BJV74DRAFT_887896 [Russula compacta]|nr:hypothetical protein BJV74DRAFT_887896 [Russula compacta]
MNTHRVSTVGAGAAGLSAAYVLSRHPDKFIVTVFEKERVARSIASSWIYAGAWTGLNVHELAIMSGFAAAYRVVHTWTTKVTSALVMPLA